MDGPQAVRRPHLWLVAKVLCAASFLVEEGAAEATFFLSPGPAATSDPTAAFPDVAIALSDARSDTAAAISDRGSPSEEPAQANAQAEIYVARISVPFSNEVAAEEPVEVVAKVIREIASVAPDDVVEVTRVSAPGVSSWSGPSEGDEEVQSEAPSREIVLDLRVARVEDAAFGSFTSLRFQELLESPAFAAAVHASLGPSSRELRLLSGQASSTTEDASSPLASTTAALTTEPASVAAEEDPEGIFGSEMLEWYFGLSLLEQVLYAIGAAVAPCFVCATISCVNRCRRRHMLKRRMSRVGASPACSHTKFRFIKASRLREMTELPVRLCHQDLPEDWFADVLISPLDVLLKTHRRSCLAVSRRWEETRHPDPGGDQIEVVRRHLLDCPHIEHVWIDYWCMPQGEECTKEQTAYLQEVVDRYTWLFMAVPVLIILDLEYVHQFWTCLEAFLAMHDPVTELENPTGLASAPSLRRQKETGEDARYFVHTIGSNFEERVGMLGGENPALRLMSLKTSTNSTNSHDGDAQLERVGRDIKASIRYLDAWRDRPLKRALAILKRLAKVDDNALGKSLKKRALNALKRLRSEIREAHLEFKAQAIHKQLTKEDLANVSRKDTSSTAGTVVHHDRKSSKMIANSNTVNSIESKRSRRSNRSDTSAPVRPGNLECVNTASEASGALQVLSAVASWEVRHIVAHESTNLDTEETDAMSGHLHDGTDPRQDKVAKFCRDHPELGVSINCGSRINAAAGDLLPVELSVTDTVSSVAS